MVPSVRRFSQSSGFNRFLKNHPVGPALLADCIWVEPISHPPFHSYSYVAMLMAARQALWAQAPGHCWAVGFDLRAELYPLPGSGHPQSPPAPTAMGPWDPSMPQRTGASTRQGQPDQGRMTVGVGCGCSWIDTEGTLRAGPSMDGQSEDRGVGQNAGDPFLSNFPPSLLPHPPADHGGMEAWRLRAALRP